MIMYKNDQRANQRQFLQSSSTHYMLYNCGWMMCGVVSVHLCGRSCDFYIVRLGAGGQLLLLRCDVGFVAIHVAAAVVVGMIAGR